MDDLELYKKAYLREKAARQKAEQTLEDLSREIYFKNQELESANQLLQEQQQELVQAEKGMAMGTLVAGVIHEINNPLAFVLSNFKYLVRTLQKQRDDVGLEGKLAAEVIDVVEDISDGLRRIEETVSNLRMYTHSSAQQFEACDINELLYIALKLVQPRLDDSTKIDLKTADEAIVLGDPGQLVQVFSNLLLNASQSSDSSVDVDVEVERGPGEIVVHVQDDGEGIDQAVLDKIFDPFFTTKEIGKGSGMGLPVVYGILEKHGGKVEIETEQGIGTLFSVKLPAFGSQNLKR